MAETSLKSKSFKGVFWSGIDRVSYYGIQFVVNIIMARMLTPSDYGVIGIMMVYISFFNIFVDGGFTTALIQKKDASEDDFNTVWLTNLLTSILLYILTFFLAPTIGYFYNNPGISSYLRVLALLLPLTALSAVPLTKLTIDINFKLISISNISSAIISGLLGIYLAYSDFGVWSLVYMHISQFLCRCVLLNVMKHWTPCFSFNYNSFRKLFAFSLKLIVSSFIDQVYNNLYPLVIGRYFSTRALGLYSRGEQFGKLPVSVINDIFLRVTLPIMSSVQDDLERLRNIYREYIELSSFVIFGVMCWLFVIAKPLIVLLLTDKWIESVMIMRILCLAMMTLHISSINRNLLYALGRSDYALKLEVIKKISAIIIFFIAIKFGVIGVCFGQLVYGLYAPILNSYYTRELINVSYLQQFIDYGKILIIAAISAVFPFYLSMFFDNIYLQILIPSLAYFTLYLTIHALFKTSSFILLIRQAKIQVNNATGKN